MFKFIVLTLLGYFIYRTLKGFLTASVPKAKINKNDKPRDDNFQQKYADKIEDADFEELE